MCFSFDPLETFEDPSVGDLSFYMTTMLQDMVTDLLLEMGEWAGRLERKPVITGPDYLGGSLNPCCSQCHG
jgi:hypothetical protein